MLVSSPGDPIWLREGVLVLNGPDKTGMPIGTILSKPCRGIFLSREIINSKNYVKAYVDNIGERYIDEDEVLDLIRGKND
jgi:hypothetical protein